ncbi:DHH family phosphoesterase [Pseudalkalibacillus decolorationis]|uniref:DHH family phosphoesterase n=1 Tax=Pseudalkalibacillus decolorationis TaxID=163879 RepID=UPI0021498A6D|nr:DHH family phosphoesterase [Pseudalkalibacillus decolorationis]
MPKFFEKRWQELHILLLFVILIVFIGIITFYNWIIGIVALFFLGGTIYLVLIKEIEFRSQIEDYITTLSHRVKKVGEEALMEMPIGIILYDGQYKIEWTNPYLTTIIEQESFIGNSLNLISGELVPFIQGEEKETIIKVNKRKYRVYLKKEERLLYFSDVTEQVEVERLYDEEQSVVSLIFLDNYDEVTQGMNDQVRSNINSKVTSILNQWANDYGIFLKRTSSERFVAIMNQRILSDLEKTKFALLDEVRELTSKQNIPLTLSIGLGSGSSNLPELGQLAQSSLDLALGRGGDQVAIKQTNGKVRFYGGKTNPMEKRTRVRARVISHALTELVADSDQVIVMGHKNPDMDAIGACMGILKVASINEKPGSIVLDPDDIDIGIQRLLEEIREKEELWEHFITAEEALERATPNTLLVVVDTHKPSMVIEERLLYKLEKVIVIDHHRRGEEFVDDPVLVYMEPYASSTAELVTELLEYQPRLRKMDILEATALLAGIIVDTKSFTLRTGSRTFDAASYLRSHGADTILVQKFLKEDIARYVKRSRLIENAAIYKGGIAIALGDDDEEFGQVLIAQAADTLLSMSGVLASFVISKRTDNKVSISARSLGDVNVQLIMEKLNGGGHLSNAAAQLENVTIKEAEQRLKQILDDYFEGGEKV